MGVKLLRNGLLHASIQIRGLHQSGGLKACVGWFCSIGGQVKLGTWRFPIAVSADSQVR